MQQNSNFNNDEIDLLDLFFSLWEGRWKILTAIIISCSLSVFYSIIKPNTFVATTEIRPLASADLDLYRISNELGFFPVNADLLHDLFIERLKERGIFKEALREYNLLDEKQFATTEDFESELEVIASSILIQPSEVNDGIPDNNSEPSWEILYECADPEKWLLALDYAVAAANSDVKDILRKRFNLIASADLQKNNYLMEDIETKIENVLEDYSSKTEKRLAFLREQAEIARRLEVAKNTIEAQIFSAQNNFVTNVNSDTPFYLRGYEAIEKEISLIESRNNERLFVNGLIELEQQKRAIEQDQTLERAQQQFETTPVYQDESFQAVSISILSTKFEGGARIDLQLVLAIVLGGFIGSAYVLVSKASKNRKGSMATQRTISNDSWF